jgi:aminopeptidase N
MDPNSSANTDAFITTHLNLDLKIDFSIKTLQGFVEISLKRIGEAKEVILDVAHVLVKSSSLDASPLNVIATANYPPFLPFILVQVYREGNCVRRYFEH